MIQLLESKGFVETRDNLIKKIGNFTEPSDFRHHNYELVTQYLQVSVILASIVQNNPPPLPQKIGPLAREKNST